MAYCPAVRRWGWWTWAAYVDDGTRFGHFAGTETTPETAASLAVQAKRRYWRAVGADVAAPARRTISEPVQVAAAPAQSTKPRHPDWSPS